MEAITLLGEEEKGRREGNGQGKGLWKGKGVGVDEVSAGWLRWVSEQVFLILYGSSFVLSFVYAERFIPASQYFHYARFALQFLSCEGIDGFEL